MDANDINKSQKATVKLLVYEGAPVYDEAGNITNKLKEVIEYEDLPVEETE